jgi:hypothetical protein
MFAWRHIWCLKSLDQNDVAVVKLHCRECVKDFGYSAEDHSKGAVHNLFMNFKKSHMVSTAHIRNWCRHKGVSFEDHPQSHVGKGKLMVLTPTDHKHLVQQGVKIVDTVNTSCV